MNEWLIILAVLLSAGLFAAGGTHIDGIGGQKWLRRFLMPICLGGLATLYAPWWACLGYALTLCFFLHLGYGDKATWLYRIFIFTGYGLSALWFGLSWWVPTIPVVCAAIFLLSNWKTTASSFVWKFCELSMGFCIGCGFVSSIINPW